MARQGCDTTPGSSGISLFVGRAAIEGAHGTAVKAQYEHKGDQEKMLFESKQIGMTFH